MNVFKSIFHSRDKPNNRSGGTPGFLFGSATSGKPVNERTAMQTSAVYACVRILSESIAGLPLHVYRCNRDGAGTSGASKEYTDFHPLYRLLRLSPNAEMTAGVFIETAVTHLLIYGNFYAQIIRYGRVYPLSPSKMTAERNDYGEFVYTCNSGKGQFCLRNRDILHVPALGYDGLAGHLPIAMAKNAIGLSLATEGYDAA